MYFILLTPEVSLTWSIATVLDIFANTMWYLAKPHYKRGSSRTMDSRHSGQLYPIVSVQLSAHFFSGEMFTANEHKNLNNLVMLMLQEHFKNENILQFR